MKYFGTELFMKRFSLLLCCLLLLLTGCGAEKTTQPPVIAATTKPVQQFTAAIAEGTGLTVEAVVSEPVSCLHDYSLSVTQMKLVERADLVILSGCGLEDFMESALRSAKAAADASANAETLPGEDGADPHIWLDPARAALMAQNIAAALSEHYPQYADTFAKNLETLSSRLDELAAYGAAQTEALSCRRLITFHDGFAYFAESLGLEVLASIEEEAGSEVAAADLISIIGTVKEYALPAVFTEVNGSESAAGIVAAETGCRVFKLDTALGDDDYFTAMRKNYDAIREALS